MTPLIYALIILFCLVASAFFSGSETALLRLRADEVDSDAKSGGGPAAAAAKGLLDSTSRLLVTILLGNNVVNILGSACASALAIHYFGEGVGLVVATVSMTLVVLLFSEVLPKAIAAGNPKRVAYIVSLPLYLLHKSLFLVHIIFDKLVDPIVKRVAGLDSNQMDSSEEVLRIARRLRDQGAEGTPASIIAATAGAAEMTVSEIMIPRTEIVAFSVNTPAPELLDQMVEEGHTRAPIYEDSLDSVLGIIHIKDLIYLVRSKKTDIRKALKPVLRVPERKPILRLLEDMQHAFAHMALVKDEFGVTLGVVTQEDILEEIVGEIRDEFDKEELETIQKVSDGSFEVLGRVLVIDFNRETGLNLEAEKGDTLSGLVFNKLGRAPRQGDEVPTGNYTLRVVRMAGSRIAWVRVIRGVQGDNGHAEEAQ
ncbi:MAG: hemolysin family protein [Bdellovibrionota bacterium]